MEKLFENIKKMGMDWFLVTLENWPEFSDIENIEEVVGDLNSWLEEEISNAQ